MSITEPLVSVMLCTHNRRSLLPLALESYLSQDYENKELIMVDDGDDLIADMVDIPGATYLLHAAQNLSQKRNAGIKAACGEFIVHFDDDDWSGPQRIGRQLEHLGDNKVIGYSRAWWYDTRSKIAAYASCGVWGASLLYERQWALDHPWDETRISGEDAWFLAHGRVAEMEGGNDFVARTHGGNRDRPYGKCGWAIASSDQLPEGFRKCLG